MSKVDLRVDGCTFQAAEYAVMHWHYSKRMPLPPLVKYGVWEDGVFLGCILFARGNNPSLGKSYGLGMTEVCELVRIALNKHASPVSKIGARCIRLLRAENPGLRLIVSFADPAHGHHGGIYQAMNWVYAGESASSWEWFHEGRWKHNREVTSGAFGKGSAVQDYKSLPRRLPPPKYRYLYPLDDAMRKQIEPLRQPYPKRVHAAEAIQDATGDQPEEGGASPTLPLHSTATAG